jgi:hypothetical protein
MFPTKGIDFKLTILEEAQAVFTKCCRVSFILGPQRNHVKSSQETSPQSVLYIKISKTQG